MEEIGQSTVHQMTMHKMMLNDIEEAFYNPRKEMKKGSKKYENLKMSIEEFGDVEPLVVNEVNNRLIGGHQRLKVLRDLGYTEVEVSIVHFENETEEKALNIALNKIEGKWDKAKLADVIRDIDSDYNALDLGFEEADIMDFLTNGDDATNDVIDGDKVDDMDKGISLKTEAASSIVAIAGVRFPIPATVFSAMEQDIIQQGYFTDKEIGEILKQRFKGEI